MNSTTKYLLLLSGLFSLGLSACLYGTDNEDDGRTVLIVPGGVDDTGRCVSGCADAGQDSGSFGPDSGIGFDTAPSPPDAGPDTIAPDTRPPADTGPDCRRGTPPCNGTCVDLQTNANHCGRCGNACGAGATCQSGQCQTLSKLEALVRETNEARSTQTKCASGTYPPAPPVTANPELRKAAQQYAERMARRDFFAHKDPYNGSTPQTRVRATNYRGRFAGENIAAGRTSAERTVQQWLTSKTGHCKNLMNAGHTDIGAGYSPRRNGSKYQAYWVQVFGRR